MEPFSELHMFMLEQKFKRFLKFRIIECDEQIQQLNCTKNISVHKDQRNKFQSQKLIFSKALKEINNLNLVGTNDMEEFCFSILNFAYIKSNSWIVSTENVRWQSEAISLLKECIKKNLPEKNYNRGMAILNVKKVNPIFISYSSKDKSVIQKIVASLEEAGFNVWIDERDIKIGDSINLVNDVPQFPRNSQRCFWGGTNDKTLLVSKTIGTGCCVVINHPGG